MSTQSSSNYAPRTQPYFEGINEYQPDFTPGTLRIGIVMARFNPEIGEALLKGCVEELEKMGLPRANITLITVPGALEIPLILKKMAKSGCYSALIALGAVIRGETYHFELVSNEMGAGIMQIALSEMTPVANGVLTVENEDQARQRTAEKGRDCARAAVEMANVMKVLA